MSHFVTYVILDLDEKQRKNKAVVNLILDEAMDKFSENLEVDEYKTNCWCIGSEARTEAHEAYQAAYPRHGEEVEEKRNKLRDFEVKIKNEVGEEFDTFFLAVGTVCESLVKQGAPEKIVSKYKKEEEALAKEWKELHARKDNFITEHIKNSGKEYNADKDCETCNGTGEYDTTYNPDSKWDWYQIGGRWQGALSDYDPSMDPANMETCNICHGLGKRWWKEVPVPVGEKALVSHQDENGVEMKSEACSKGDEGAIEHDCNGCNGIGICEVWPTSRDIHDGDITTVEHALNKITSENGEDFLPFSMNVNGDWFDKGDMGWFGMSSNNKEKDEWKEQVIKLLNENIDKTLVVVDCHI